MSKIKNILVLAPEYPADDLPKTTTPVVHYFCKEWVKMGINVVVINYMSNFPSIYYSLTRPIVNIISSKEGFHIRTERAKEICYTKDNVLIKRILLTKYFPHRRYSIKQISEAVKQTISFCNNNKFVPDIIVGHWADPCLDIFPGLKEKWSCPIALSVHGTYSCLYERYKKDADLLLSNVDILGYRSNPIMNSFKNYIHENKPGFLCYSGIPDNYIVESKSHSFSNISTFIFIGTLIKRKYPAEIIPALVNCYPNRDFVVTYIGNGQEEKNIKKFIKLYSLSNQVKMLGRLMRDDVISELEKTDVLIMNSSDETFGLVYLEAMAAGCIVVASYDEGFDGIIINGKNGFLCKAGDTEDLSKTIKIIKNLSSKELHEISTNAILTARSMTESKVARIYLSNLETLL